MNLSDFNSGPTKTFSPPFDYNGQIDAYLCVIARRFNRFAHRNKTRTFGSITNLNHSDFNSLPT